MIVKMKFLSISGPRTDIDRVSASYLSKYEMQLENAITELKTTDNLMPFMDVNPYKEPLSKAEQYVLMLAQPKGEMDTSLTADEILTMIRDLNHDYLDLKAREDRLKKQKEELLEKLHELEPFQPLELNLKEVYGYQYMKVRFGRVNVEYYQKLEKYLFLKEEEIYKITTALECIRYGLSQRETLQYLVQKQRRQGGNAS